MSSILKALKKLEDEKAIRQPDTLNIDSDILRVESSQRHSVTGIVLAALLLFGGGSVATYLYMKPASLPSAETNKKVAEEPKSIQPPLQSQDPAVTTIKAEKLPEVIEIVPAKRLAADKVVTHKLQKQSTHIKSVPVKTSSRPEYQLKKHEDQRAIPAVMSAPPHILTKAVPELKVDGIAYQDGSSDSVAIVNGEPVASGSMVAGVKIEVIKKDRVRFSYKGEAFDIPLGKSNR